MGVTKENPIHVLHVDDEAGILKVTKQILELQGLFQVDSAGSVEDAFSKMKLNDYDVIVSDYQMPVKDGLQFLEELREKNNKIPFILFTGKGREEVAIEALNLGADRYINKIGKPETVYDELKHNIRQVVKNQKSMETLLFEQTLIKTLLDYSKDFIYFKDKKARYVRVSEPYLDFFKLSKEDIIGRTALDLFPDDVGKQIYDEELQIIKTGKPIINKEEYSNGVCALTTTIPWVDKKRNIVGLFGISRDITERKKAEDRILQQNEFLNNTLESLSYPFLVINADDYTIQLGNTVSGFDNAKKQFCYEVTHKQNKPCTNEHPCPLEKVKKTKKPVIEEHIHCDEDGSSRNVEVHGYPIFDDEGNVVQMIEYCLDITERKNVEEELNISEERLKILFEFAPDAIYLNDLKGNFVDGNKAAEEITGYKREKLTGKSFLSLKLLPRKQLLKATKLLARNVLGKPTGPDEFVLNRKDNTQVQVEIRTYPVNIKGQKLVLGIARDITKRKGMEEEKNRLFFDIGERVKELNCLYEISKLVEKSDSSLEEILKEISNLLPQAYQHIDDVCSRIIFENREFKTKKFKVTPYKQSSDIKIHGKKVGVIEVYYLKEKPMSDEGPFLKEERVLIDTVAVRVGQIIDHRKEQDKRRESDMNFRLLVDGTEDYAMFLLDADGYVVNWNAGAEKIKGYTTEEIIGKHFSVFYSDEDIQSGKPELELKTARETGRCEDEGWRLRKDGTLFWANDSHSIIW